MRRRSDQNNICDIYRYIYVRIASVRAKCETFEAAAKDTDTARYTATARARRDTDTQRRRAERYKIHNCLAANLPAERVNDRARARAESRQQTARA